MQGTMTVIREPKLHTYAEPLSGLRVSWGSVLAGTVTLFAVSILLWLLAFAIVMLAMHPTVHSFMNSLVALWICGMVTTLVGAFIGGRVAGSLPGNPRRGIGAVHGFVSWAFALVLASAAQLALLNGSDAAIDTTVAMAAASSSAAGEGTTTEVPPEVRAERALVSLGYPHGEATRIVRDAPGRAQEPNPANPWPGPGPSRKEVATAAIHYGIRAGWTLFGTWFVALVLAVMGGASGARRSRPEERRDEGERVEGQRAIPPRPLEPLPTP